jgi:hypothetical protein
MVIHQMDVQKLSSDYNSVQLTVFWIFKLLVLLQPLA